MDDPRILLTVHCQHCPFELAVPAHGMPIGAVIGILWRHLASAHWDVVMDAFMTRDDWNPVDEFGPEPSTAKTETP